MWRARKVSLRCLGWVRTVKVDGAPSHNLSPWSHQPIIWSLSIRQRRPLVAQTQIFPMKQPLGCQTERPGTSLPWACSCRCGKLIKHPSNLPHLPLGCAQVLQGEVAKVTIPCAVRQEPISAARAGADPPWASSATVTSTTANRSRVLFCCSCWYLWNIQDSSALFWATAHQQLTLAEHSFLSWVLSPWISIIYMLKTTTEFTFISIPPKIPFNCCMLCSLPKDRNHWVGDTILQCH